MRNLICRLGATGLTAVIMVLGVLAAFLLFGGIGWATCSLDPSGSFLAIDCSDSIEKVLAGLCVVLVLFSTVMVGGLLYFMLEPLWRNIYLNCHIYWSRRKRS